MQPILPNLAALAVALIFYAWRAHADGRRRKQQVLRQRVAYLLWVVAERAGGYHHPVSIN